MATAKKKPAAKKKVAKKKAAKKKAAKKAKPKKAAKKAKPKKAKPKKAVKKPVKKAKPKKAAPKPAKKAKPKKAVKKPVAKAKPKKAVKAPAAKPAAPKVAPPKPAPAQPAAQPTGEAPRKGSDKYSIDVTEGEDKRYFVITVNNYRNFFTLDEMRKLVNVCHDATDERDGMMRLYNWFKTFRNDVIINTRIEGSFDPALTTMYKYLVTTYSVKD